MRQASGNRAQYYAGLTRSDFDTQNTVEFMLGGLYQQSVNHNMKNTFIACVLLCLFSHSVMALGGDSSQSICHQLDDSKPWLYLGFEKIESTVSGSKTKSEIIVLRLSNNSACDLEFVADTPTTIQVVRAPNTKPRIERTNRLLPNVLADLHYRLIDWDSKEQLSMISRGHLAFTRVLPSGQSTIFAVPAWLFKEYSEIGVTIQYRRVKASEGANGSDEWFTQKVEAPPNIVKRQRARL